MQDEPKRLLTTTDVAREFGVHPTTVILWDTKNILRACRTGGGHRRFRREDVDALLHKNGHHPAAAG